MRKSSASSAPPRADVTREQILAGAARLFRTQGYAATTLRQVADAADIKAGSIYYHFASKEAILVEVLDKGIALVMDAVRRRIDALPATASWREKIAAGIEGHLYGMLHYGDFTSANIRIYGLIPASAKKKHRVVRRAYAEYWDRLFAAAREAGELRTDTSLAITRLFVIGALNWTVEWYNPQRGAFKEFAAQITRIIFDGILQTHPVSPSSRAGRK
jgi:AcrR family transcriptional regulator